jgi:Tfp pilus assembly protein PilP
MKHARAAVIAASLLALVGLGAAWAQEAPQPGPAAPVANAPAPPQAEGQKFEIKKEVYTYQSVGRRDPFLSIIAATKLAQEREMRKGAAPLEAFDVMQMTVVAIVKDQSAGEFHALLRMPDGKHFSVKKGSTVGLHGGRVTDITINRLVVTEMVRNYKGEPVSQDTELKLRKGEER